MAQYRNETPEAKLWNGQIKIGVMTRIGEYEQEIHTHYLSLSLEEAVHTVYEKLGIPANREMILATLSRYLFDTKVDTKIHIANLSGGQKARFQLIKMFANTPNLLILDEPTNHLDLPSIEELENALLSYTGGILYISHDTSFIKNFKAKL